ncbi:hypothetical protein ACINKY_21170 [Paenibacillus illinoisensis]|uniref:Uncharacterized protein n=1 Tax=Paenibacillus illinoisensis TaxID=59845 RepID=A0ABW8HYF1_9BACL
MNEQMIILVIKSKDMELKKRYGKFREYATLSVSREISFQERVDILESMGDCAEKVQQQIAALSEEGVSVERIEDSVINRLPAGEVRAKLSNGLFNKADLLDLLQHQGDQLPEEFTDLCCSLADQLGQDDYILFWNMGELEAHALLSH